MDKKPFWMWLCVALFCSVATTSMLTVYYYGENLRYQTLYQDTLGDLKAVSIQVSVVINYGNGTKEWHNNTRVPIGISLLNATRMVAEVNYTPGQWGAFVNTINNVGGEHGRYWFWYYWNSSSQWETKWVASDAYILHHEDIVSWVYVSS